MATLSALLAICILYPLASRAQYSEKDDAPRPQLTAEDFSAEKERTDPVAIRSITLDAELVPNSHQLKARAKIQFQALRDTGNAQFELNDNLFPTKISAEDGRQLTAQRTPGRLAVQVGLGKTLPKGQSSNIIFEYAGNLADAEHSPVEGVQLAYIGDEGSYLLYPGRWFPVTGYSLDRYTGELHITVPNGLTVVSGGTAQAPTSVGGKTTFNFRFDKPGFPGSIAVVSQQPHVVNAEGLTMKVYFSPAHQDMAQAYGEGAARMVTFYSDKFGPPAVANLSIVEIDDRSLGGYAGPEVVFLARRAVSNPPNIQLMAQEVAQQWWRGLVSPSTNADLWIDHGLATFSAALYMESERGEGALVDRVHQLSIDALTHDNIPVRAAGRLPDFSPQFHSVMYSKAAVVLHMLRWVIGDDAFFRTVKTFADQFAFKSASTEEFEKLAEQSSSAKLGPFFIQWMESTGASDFKAEYVVYRVNDGYRVAGKIHQDMDTFSMPVEVKVETDGEPVIERVQVTGRDSEFSVSTKGRPKKVEIDPNNRVLKYNDAIRVQVAVARGEQQVQARDYQGALEDYQKALDVNRMSSLAHYRVGEAFFQLRNYQSAANAFREALNGDLVPKWTEVWSHINLGKIFDVTGQRDRAVNEYQQALRTKDDTQGALQQANQYLQKPYERVSREIEAAEAEPDPANAPPSVSTDQPTNAPADKPQPEQPGPEDRPRLRRH
ncbi:MAG: tetratricopeptide repeat protein [Acidobacteria bacterium]|nr:tetratricopeptide repeat protein [Acidobacteriota bacterium]